ncbi:MAG: alkaline phosphatase family protein [Chthoniobacterales bacterium]|nr:alkaline phosphatase family protein [Chthoniobacterales bacterium]
MIKKSLRWFTAAATVAVLFCVDLAVAAAAKGHAEHVVIVIWDGMRPEFVREELTPTLWKLSRAGVTFQNHHALYPSSTEVNGTGIATGVHPRRNGLMGNWEYRPEIDPEKPMSRETPDALIRGDQLSGGKYLALPTLAERVQAAGHRTAIAGTKWGTVLQDRSRQRESAAAKDSVVFFGRSALPEAALESFKKVLGAFPERVDFPNRPQDSWTTRALTDVLWKEGVPKFSLLWLSDPDFTQHHTAPGSAKALAAMKSSDDHLATVLAALEAKKVRDKTDVLVVSDHGFATVERSVDVTTLLNDAGFSAVTKFKEEPRRGQIMVVGNGGSVFFYVIERDPAVRQRLVEFLQGSDFAGVLFTREKAEGTFPLGHVQIDTRGAPDVVMAFRWHDGANEFGARGLIHADWKRGAGHGTHATLSKFDMHNTMIAAGPDFRRGFVNDLPTGNIDLAPTILAILGIDSGERLDGRVLTEAMVHRELPAPRAETERIEATRQLPSGLWRQYLQISRVRGTSYFDEGNGSFTAGREAVAAE